MRVKVYHVIAALEELQEAATKLDEGHDDGLGNEYAKHLSWTLDLLNNPEICHPDDVLISFE